MTELGGRNPAWDGMRALAVVAVLVYHVEGHPLSGGFLGVSLFFTLSGFVITRTVLAELDRTARLSVSGFWARRFRRLLPPIGVCMVLVLLYGHIAATGNQRSALRWDMIATLTDWMNWRTLATGATYGGQDLSPSPLLHAWSLSIEEQAYLLMPLLVLVGWHIARRRGVVIALAAALAASCVGSLLSADNAQLWYLGTHVRIGEILVGALLAVLSTSPAWATAARASAWLAIPAAAFMTWAALGATTVDAWLPRGGLLLHAVATSVVIAAASAGVWRRVLGWRPLAALGLVSYGVYLYHWPIYLWITPARTGWDRWPTTALRVAVTLTLAVSSYLLLERRVIALRRRQRRTLAVGAIGLAVAVGVASVAAPLASADQRVTIESGLVAPPSTTVGAPTTATTSTAAATTIAAPAAEPATPSAPAPEPTTAPPPPTIAGWGHLDGPPLDPSPLGRPPVILVVGDSAAGTLGFGLQRVSTATGSAVVYTATEHGCPVGDPAELRWNDDVEFTPDRGCTAWRDGGGDIVEFVHPDLVVSLVSIWEVVDRKLAAGGAWVSIGDPDVDDALRADLATFADTFAPPGTRLVWLLPPPLHNSIYANLPGPLPEEDPARLAALDTIVRSVLDGRPDTFTYDLPAELGDRYGDPAALDNRVDGFHWSDAGADREAAWLLPLLVAVADGGA